MIVGLLWIKFIIVPKPSKEFPHFNEKNYLKAKEKINFLLGFLFCFLKQESLKQPIFYDFTYKNDNTCLRPNKRVSIN